MSRVVSLVEELLREVRALEAENAELKAKLAVYEAREEERDDDKSDVSASSLLTTQTPTPSATSSTSAAPPTSDTETVGTNTKERTSGPATTTGGGPFRAVKDFLFKPKKEKEDSSKQKTPQKSKSSTGGTTDTGEALSFGGGKDKGGKQKKQDRWIFLRTLEGHGHGVVEISCCLDESLPVIVVGSASFDGTARIWSLDGAAAVYHGHKGAVNTIRFNASSSQSQSRIACTTGVDGTCQLWKVPNIFFMSRSPTVRRGDGTGSSVDASPDRSDEEAVGTLYPTPPLTPKGSNASAASPVPVVNGPVVESVLTLPTLSTFREHTDVVVGADWVRGLASGDSVVVSGSWDASVKVWDASTMQAMHTIRCEFPVAHSSPSSSSSSFSSNSAHLTNVMAHPLQPLCVGPGNDGLCRVWDLRDGRLVDLLSHSSERSPVSHALFSHDGGLIMTGGDDRLIKLWDPRNTQQPLDAVRCSSIQSKFSLSKKTNTLAIPMHDRKTRICDTQGHIAGTVDSHKQHRAVLTAAMWSEDESLLLTSSMDEKANLVCWVRT